MNADVILAAARRYVGCPYVWGGKGRELWSPQGIARHAWVGHVFDCSGLIGQVARDVGLKDRRATHSAQTWFNELPAADDPNARGVLRFYGRGPEDVTHVALCAGSAGGQVLVIEAAGGNSRTTSPLIAVTIGARVRAGPERRIDFVGARAFPRD